MVEIMLLFEVLLFTDIVRDGEVTICNGFCMLQLAVIYQQIILFYVTKW